MGVTGTAGGRRSCYPALWSVWNPSCLCHGQVLRCDRLGVDKVIVCLPETEGAERDQAQQGLCGDGVLPFPFLRAREAGEGLETLGLSLRARTSCARAVNPHWDVLYSVTLNFLWFVGLSDPVELCVNWDRFRELQWVCKVRWWCRLCSNDSLREMVTSTRPFIGLLCFELPRTWF